MTQKYSFLNTTAAIKYKSLLILSFLSQVICSQLVFAKNNYQKNYKFQAIGIKKINPKLDQEKHLVTSNLGEWALTVNQAWFGMQKLELC